MIDDIAPLEPTVEAAGTSVAPPGSVESARGGDAAGQDLEAKLRGQVKKWRDKLLDLGNHNPLIINCSFHPMRGGVEFVDPDCETVWRRLAADGTGGSDPPATFVASCLVPPPTKFDQPEFRGSDENSGPEKPKE